MIAIVDFFTGILDILMSVVQLFVTTISSVFWLVTNLPQMVAGITASFAYTPDFLFPFLSGSIALLVVLAIMRMM